MLINRPPYRSKLEKDFDKNEQISQIKALEENREVIGSMIYMISNHE